MKISTSLNHATGVGRLNAADAARLMKDVGFDGIDLDMTQNQMEPEKVLLPEWEEAVTYTAKAARNAGLELAQCHLPYYPGHLDLPGDGSYEAYENFLLPECKRALEVCGKIGCTTAVLHPYFDADSREHTLEGNLRFIRKLIPLMEGNGIRLAVENVYGFHYANVFVSTAEDIAALLNATKHPLVGACLDTGHARIFELSVPDMARIYGKKLFALHINGNAGKDEHVIPYSMPGWCEKIDYRTLTQALREIDFDGFYNLEVCSGNMPPQVIRAFYGYAAAMARALSNPD